MSHELKAFKIINTKKRFINDPWYTRINLHSFKTIKSITYLIPFIDNIYARKLSNTSVEFLHRCGKSIRLGRELNSYGFNSIRKKKNKDYMYCVGCNTLFDDRSILTEKFFSIFHNTEKIKNFGNLIGWEEITFGI